MLIVGNIHCVIIQNIGVKYFVNDPLKFLTDTINFKDELFNDKNYQKLLYVIPTRIESIFENFPHPFFLKFSTKCYFCRRKTIILALMLLLFKLLS